MSRRVSLCAMLIALAMIFSYVEVLLPINFALPGIKLGMANIVVVCGLYLLKIQDVFMISMIRIILTSYLFGNGVSILYSLSGGILSFLIMLLLFRIGSLSVYTVSVGGGVFHNIGQLLAAALVINSLKILYYLPFLLLAGVVTGVLIGILSDRILKALKKSDYARGV